MLPHHFPWVFPSTFPPSSRLLRLPVGHHLLLAVAFLALALALAQLALHVAELATCLAGGFQEGPGTCGVGSFTGIKSNSWCVIMACVIYIYIYNVYQ